MYRFMKVACISSSTFMNHQKYYLYPSIAHVWHNYQKNYIRDVRGWKISGTWETSELTLLDTVLNMEHIVCLI